jgi:hypothetical protein
MVNVSKLIIDNYLPCGRCGKNSLSTLNTLYSTLVSCIDPGWPVDTYVNLMSKSQTADTLWVGIPVFAMYLTCSSGGSVTRICVPSSAQMQSLKYG